MRRVFQRWMMPLTTLVLTFVIVVPCAAAEEPSDQTLVEETTPVVAEAPELSDDIVHPTGNENPENDNLVTTVPELSESEHLGDDTGMVATMPVDETEAPVGDNQPSTPDEIVATVTIQNPDDYTNIPAVTVWENNYNALLEAMVAHRVVRAMAVSPGGGEQALTLRVDWDLDALQTDFSTPGNYVESAPILLPSNAYRFAEGELQVVSIPVIVEEGLPPKKVITAVESMDGFLGYAIPQGSDWNSFFYDIFPYGDMRNVVPCTTENGTIYAHVRWMNPNYDTQKTGVVLVKGEIFLPEDAVLDEGVILPEISFPVSVQAEPTLDCFYYSQGSIAIPWVIDDAQRAIARAQMREGDGAWYDASDDIVLINTAVYIPIDILKTDVHYEVQVLWEDGKTNIFSFMYDGTDVTAQIVYGDRDGGDSKDTKYDNDKPKSSGKSDRTSNPVDISKPVDTANESNPEKDVIEVENPSAEVQQSISLKGEATVSEPTATSPVATIINEWYETIREFFGVPAVQASVPRNGQGVVTNESALATNGLSGAQLKLMRDHGAVRFSELGVTVTLSDEALDSLNLTDDSQFVIKIGQHDKGFSLDVTLDGKTIEKLPNTKVQMRYNPENAKAIFQLVDENGKVVDEGEYDAELGIVTFEIQTTGSFHIVESNVQGTGLVKGAVEAEASQRSVTLPIGAIAVILVTLFGLGWRKHE